MVPFNWRYRLFRDTRYIGSFAGNLSERHSFVNHGLVYAPINEICGGIAALTENVFGRKLNYVTGLGMGTSVNTEAIEQLEAAYHARALDVEIDLCPHGDATTLAVLTERGYAVNAFSNTYVRTLRDKDLENDYPKASRS